MADLILPPPRKSPIRCYNSKSRSSKRFHRQKEKQSETLAAAAGEQISPEFKNFFDAAINGDWQTVTNRYESFKHRHPQYGHPHQHSDVSLRTSYWGPVLEIALAYDHVVRCEPAYTQMAVDDIINSIPSGSIYFGGTDTGRGLPTAFCKSQVDADPFYTLTQNALADGTYLEYLKRTYGNQKDIARKDGRQLARCVPPTRRLHAVSDDLRNTNYTAARRRSWQLELDNQSKTIRNAKAADAERKKQLWEQPKLFRDNRVDKAILADVQKQAGNQNPGDGKTLYIPTMEDSQQCFQDYSVDAQKRLENHQLKPGEDVKVVDGQTQISGQVAVMQINGLLAKLVFDKNPDHEFYIEESYPLDWMASHLEPHGLILKINREPLTEMSEATVQADREFWQPRVNQMIGGWLEENTQVSTVTAFGEKVFVKHDLAGFSGDPRFVQNDYATRIVFKIPFVHCRAFTRGGR